MEERVSQLLGDKAMAITLSTTSQDLISKLCEKNANFALQSTTTIEREALLAWLKQTYQINSDEDTFFLIASLQASLLKDLHDSLNSGPKNEDKSKAVGWSDISEFVYLATAGTVYFACEGFGGVAAIVGLFSSVPNLALFAVGTLFSLLSVIAFYSFDLVEISKSLGIKSSETPKLLDVLLDEFKQIKNIRSQLAKSANKTKEELECDLAIARMLLKRHEELNEARMKIKEALEHPYLKAGKAITAAIAGVIFFSAGFFAGQTVAVAIASLFVTSIAVTAWPILVASVAVGIAAFSIYWFVERPGFENLISRWKGLDKEKVDKLCKSDVVERETEKLQNLIHELEEKINLHQVNTNGQTRVHELETEVRRLNIQIEEMTKTLHETKPPQIAQANNDEHIVTQGAVKELEVVKDARTPSSHAQYSMFGELRRTKSMGDLSAREHTMNASI